MWVEANREVARMTKRLYRSNDRILGGVAAGVAEYFGLDPSLLRIVWAAFMLSGVGVLFYFVCWIIIPPAPSTHA